MIGLDTSTAPQPSYINPEFLHNIHHGLPLSKDRVVINVGNSHSTINRLDVRPFQWLFQLLRKEVVEIDSDNQFCV